MGEIETRLPITFEEQDSSTVDFHYRIGRLPIYKSAYKNQYIFTCEIGEDARIMKNGSMHKLPFWKAIISGRNKSYWLCFMLSSWGMTIALGVLFNNLVGLKLSKFTSWPKWPEIIGIFFSRISMQYTLWVAVLNWW